MEPNNFSNINPEHEEQELSINEIIYLAKIHWKWFVLSVVLCLAVACLYIKITPKEYTRSATVMIKDNKGGTMSESAIFQEFEMFSIKSSVDNEILVFQARRLMKDVISRLKIDVSYKIRDGLKQAELYTQAPVSVRFLDAEEATECYLTVTPVSGTEVVLSGFSEDGESPVTAALKDTIATPIGRLTVSPTLYYSDLYYNRDIQVTKNSLPEVADAYQQALRVSLASKQATIINLSLTDESVARAEDILNTLIAIYNEDAISDKNQITRNTSEFINERLIIIEKELGSVDADIEVFKRENQLTDIHSETGMYLQESSAYNKEGLSLDNQVTLARFIREYLSDPSKSSDLIPSNTGVKDVNIESQIGEYNEMLLKRNRLISNSSDKNPVVMDLNNSLIAMKQTIIRAIDNLIVGLNIQIQNTRERELQTVKRITAVPSQQKYVLSIERQQKIKEELYLYLLNKREENELTQAITESNARIIDPATGSDIPVAPRTSIILLAGLMLGVVIPAGGIWLKETMNTTVRNRQDIEDAVRLPLLGEIPQRDKKDKNDVALRQHSRDSVSEAFRIVRTNMDFMRVKAREMKVLMVLSAFPGAGKSFVSINLGMSFALMNKKVVIVDLDIRKGTMSERLGKEGKGVTNYLSGQITDFREIIYPYSGESNLDIIPSGPIPPNPAELMLSENLDKLTDSLRDEYDYIILDSLPTYLVADPIIANRVADLSIYVVRVGFFQRRMLPELNRLYESGKLKNMAILLNGVDHQKGGYGYGYGYGYGNEPNRNK